MFVHQNCKCSQYSQHYRGRCNRGMSLVEVVVASAVMLLVFGGLMAFFQTAIKLVGVTKARAGAVSLANERLEYIRSLSYNDVGTVNGIPSGNIPQNSTTTLNSVIYNERILIEYVDAPEDGVGAADSNGILADYKRVKIEYNWNNRGQAKTLSLISNIVPPGIESTAGGGTLTVNVFSAAAAPITGAAVRVFNDTATTTVDVTRYTNASGVAQFAGAPAAANYQITVTGTNMSTDQTYVASASNPNPITSPVAVVEGQVSTMNFQIDTLSDLLVHTVGLPVTNSVSDSFTDATQIGQSSNTIVSGGAVILFSSPDYVSSGDVRATSTTPDNFASWDKANFTIDTPTNTSALVQVYSVSGNTYTLVPDSDLAGNSTGFSTSTITLSGLSTTTYPSLALGATLSTSDASSTPSLLDWNIDYIVSEPPIGNIAFTMTGAKIIGTTASSTPVYKYQQNHSTNSSGELSLPNLEWDIYDIVLSGSSYIITEACKPLPYRLDPGVSETLKLTLEPAPTHSLHVYVVNTTGQPINGAAVTLSRVGFNVGATASICGQTIFDTGLSSATDYTVSVSASGYTDSSQSSISIIGNDTLVVTMNTL